MREITNYGEVFETLVDKTTKYLTSNGLKAMILGISGGIDSTVVAAICHEVSKRTNIPLIGRSLPIWNKNKLDEINSSKLVGEAFCSDFKEVELEINYVSILDTIGENEINDYNDPFNNKEFTLKEIEDRIKNFQTPIANGNIQARLRMIYLYNLASIHGGLVMDTDNLTENNLGYFTIHGDVGDFNPIGCLWKTEVFKLAEWLANTKYSLGYSSREVVTTIDSIESAAKVFARQEAIKESLKLKPTAGLGITDSDLDEIGAESYEQVDGILQEILRLREKNANKDTILEFFYDHSDIDYDIITNIVNRHFNSEFKRKQLPIKINREELYE